MSKTIIAYQGRPGAFSEMAALRFVPDAVPASCRGFKAVVDAVTSGAAEMGVLPFCNSTAGVIAETCGLISQSPVTVLDELALPISHALIAAPGVGFDDLTKVVSHPVALAQCRRFLGRLSGIEAVGMGDTAGCVEWVMEKKAPRTAAIASAYTAQLYGASVLAEGIEDSPDNATSFMLFEAARSAARPAGIAAEIEVAI